VPDVAPVFIEPRVLPQPLATLPAGTSLISLQSEGDWYLVRFADQQWDDRVGYVHCANVRAADPAAPGAAPPAEVTPANSAPPLEETRSVAAPAGPPATGPVENVRGYLEWKHGDDFIVDGQRVRWDARTRAKLTGAASISEIPLGYALQVRGARLPDGVVVAQTLEAKPKAAASSEKDLRALFDALEAAYLQRGAMFQTRKDQGPTIEVTRDIGKIVRSGADVDRVKRMLGRLIPPSVGASRLRVYVVLAQDWSCHVMSNGAIWIYSGLLRDFSDDALAVVVGHELVHYTHAHGRRQVRRVAADQGARAALELWQAGYSRTEEDQADRVGLRYTYEGGYDIAAAPGVWTRFRGKYGEPGAMSTAFDANRFRTIERTQNIERELKLNYGAGSQ
jgi:hypothetical protein